MKDARTVLFMVLGMWIYHAVSGAFFGPSITVVHADTAWEERQARAQERTADALEKIAGMLDHIERHMR